MPLGSSLQRHVGPLLTPSHQRDIPAFKSSSLAKPIRYTSDVCVACKHGCQVSRDGTRSFEYISSRMWHDAGDNCRFLAVPQQALQRSSWRQFRIQRGSRRPLCHTELGMALICIDWKKAPTSSSLAGWRFLMTEAAWRILMARSPSALSVLI